MFAADTQLSWLPGRLFLGASAQGTESGLDIERGAICIAGSRSGKGTSLIIPNLMRWPHSTLIIDPKGENAAATWQARETFGPVHVLDPFGIADVPERLRASCNPLDGITAASLTAREDIRVIADGLVMRSNDKDAVWDDGAVTVIAGMIAHAIAALDAPSLPAMRGLLKQAPAGQAAVFTAMAEGGDALGGLAGAAASIGLDDARSAAEFVAGAARHTDWLDSPAMSAVLSRSTFSLSALKTDNASIFLVLPPAYLAEHGRFLRLFVLAALSEMTKHGLNSQPCLFVLDEFFSLGRLDMLQKAAGLLPGYGVRLFPFCQDLGQLHQLYGKAGAETFLANADAAIFFGNSDMVTLNYMSARIGMITDDELGAEPPQLVPFSRARAQLFENIHEVDSRIRIENTMRTAWQQYKLARVGKPRMPADVIPKWVGKWPGRSTATWMIVFGPIGRVYRLRLAPYFLPPPGPLPPEPKQPDKWPPRKPARLRVLGQTLFFGVIVWLGLVILFDTWRAVSPRRAGAPAREMVGAFGEKAYLPPRDGKPRSHLRENRDGR